MKSLPEALAPASLPQQLTRLVQLGESQLTALDLLAGVVRESARVRPEPEPTWFNLPWRTSAQVDIVGLIVSGDGPGLYALWIDNAPMFYWRLPGQDTRVLDLSGPKRLRVGRGQQVWIGTFPSNATYEGTMIVTPVVSSSRLGRG